MVQAYRDTWELGLHSYLTYMRDRLILSRELLSESGSIFVQISDENLHHVRELMDEIFQAGNFCGLIAFRTTGGQSTALLSSSTDYLLWYAKDKESARPRFHNPTTPKRGGTEASGQYTWVEPVDFSQDPRSMTEDEEDGTAAIPENWRILAHDTLYSQGSPSDPEDRVFVWRKQQFTCPPNTHWKPGVKSGGMASLAAANRLMLVGNTLRYKRYVDDFPVYLMDNVWNDTAISGFARKKQYAVETSAKVIERCMLMTTEPGELVLDPTCGSGTTAWVAEFWGRRWITVDVSRVPVALARQRLLTATYPWFSLKDSDRGPSAGFTYVRKRNSKGEEVGGIVPHITLGSIANNEVAAEEVLPDRPEKTSGVTRVTGPFCLESTIPTPSDITEGEKAETAETDKSFTERMLEVLRKSPILHTGDNKTLTLKSIRPPAKSLTLSAEGVAVNGDERNVAFVFGPENGSVTESLVFEAAREAYMKSYAHLFVIGLAVEAKARMFVQKCNEVVGIPSTYVQATTDLTMSDLLKTMRSSQIFSVCGLPDVNIYTERAEDGTTTYRVQLLGLDVFDPVTMQAEHYKGDDAAESDKVPAWFLDTDYNGLCFHVSQAFFPRTAAWDSLKRALKGTYDDSIWDHLAGTISEPFEPGTTKQIAVKVIDDRGNELLVVKSLSEAVKRTAKA